jgi:Brp/Blh family beta-carotene 15,15'-monooxygenase
MNTNRGNLLVFGLALTLLCATLWHRQSAEWLALGLIIVAGIPHGSFDLRAAEVWWGKTTPRRVSLILVYSTIGLGMSTACFLWPGFGLLAFLVISAIHFYEGERPWSAPLTALCVGVGAIVLPIAFHMTEASKYLGFFASPDVLDAVRPYIVTGGFFISAALASSLVFERCKRRSREVLQQAICLLAWVLLPPLSGFCVWFIGRHSRQHLERSRVLVPRTCGSRLPLDFIALSVTAIALLAPLALWFDLTDLHQLFAASIILIAGLTLPHMLLTHLSAQRLASEPHSPTPHDT